MKAYLSFCWWKC